MLACFTFYAYLCSVTPRCPCRKVYCGVSVFIRVPSLIGHKFRLSGFTQLVKLVLIKNKVWPAYT